MAAYCSIACHTCEENLYVSGDNNYVVGEAIQWIQEGHANCKVEILKSNSSEVFSSL